jgi:hypothetical protein
MPLNVATFLPFPIVDESTIGPNFGSPLDSALSCWTKLFWTAKTFDWAINLAYNVESSLFGGDTDIGTVVGSGTSPLIETETTYPRGTGALPGERLVQNANDNLPLGATFGGGVGTMKGSTTGQGSYTGTATFSPLFFYGFGPGAVTVVTPGTLYRARILVEQMILGQFGCFLASYAYGSSPSGANCIISGTGLPTFTVPLVQTVGGDVTAATVSGTVSLNFNNFWIP